MATTSELKIIGVGEQSGGTFKTVRISGLGSVAGDIEGEKVLVEGSGAFKGSVKASQVIGKGNISIDGNLDTDLMENYGNCSIQGVSRVRELMNKGKLSFKQTLKSNRITSYGHIAVEGDVEAEHFISEGAFKINGLLNANQIDVKVSGLCSVKEIGGEEINITLSNRVGLKIDFLNKLLPVLEKKLQVTSIEGNHIYLENTEADVVRGHDVKIGPNCRIKLVEYTGEVTVDMNATVERKSRA